MGALNEKKIYKNCKKCNWSRDKSLQKLKNSIE